MKYIVIVPDGASDYPQEILGDKTPLQVADTPNIDSLIPDAILGRVKTIPKGFRPASDIANLSLLGYPPDKYYTGRGPLEAANLGVELKETDLAFRCNLITEAEGKLFDYSAGHITDKEAHILINYLDEMLGTQDIKFVPGKSYRNLVVIKNGVLMGLDKLGYTAPHDIIGESIEKYLPRGENSSFITDLMFKAKKLLGDHEVNKVRIDLGENPANMIWLWGAGPKPSMESFYDKFGITGAIISAVDLIKGIGKIIGFKVINVEGATGYYDTNYQGKAEAALRALDEVDFVFVHIEAPDEAGHNGDLRMKITCLERIDKLVVGTILEGIKNKDVKILFTPDHPTPTSKRTHTREPVPFFIYPAYLEGVKFTAYSEFDASQSPLYFDSGRELLEYFLKV